jgi:PKD repeat protein
MRRLISFLILAVFSISYTASVFAQQDCATAAGITDLPFSATGLTTAGSINDYGSADACGSSAMVNEDYVFRFTPGTNMQINIALLNTAIVNAGMLPFANIGLFVTDLCPNDPMANCVAYIDNVGTNPSISNIDLTSGTTYYIVISTANTMLGSSSNVNFDIEITKNMDHDLGLTSIEVAPSSCDLNESVVGCYITNNGLYPETGFELNYSINGGPWNAQTFTGTINPSETTLFEFTNLATFPIPDEYEIEVAVVLGTDENPSNNISSITRILFPTYNTFPFVEDFELNNGFFFAGGTGSTWAYGNPDELDPALIINSAASGDFCWVTNLMGNTGTNENSYLESPCFDLSSLFLPTLELSAWVDFAIFGNSGSITASIDGGTNFDIPVYTFAATTGWTTISVGIEALAGQSNVKFRINYAGGFLNGNGIAIDNFTIKEAILNDLGVSAIYSPISGCGLTANESIIIEITNYGAQAQSGIPVTYSIDGGTTWLASPETAMINLQPGQTYNYTFVATANLATYGEYLIIAKTVNVGDEDITNDEFELAVVSQNTIDANDYVESFESGAAGWFAYGTNSTMELATPAAGLINMAGEGSVSWVTNAIGFNHPAEISYLESPCYDFTGFVNPKFKALVQYETNPLLTNFFVEYSIDGITWDTVNAGLSAENWYGTDMISIGTWNGSSAGWIQVSTDIPEVIGQSSVKFRFVFNNGMFSMQDTEGVAIDQIVIYDCDNLPNAEFAYAVAGLNVEFINESENATSYSWNFGDNDFFPSTSTEENPTFAYLMDGSYYVELTATNECSSSIYGTIIDISTVSEILNSTNISLYPNPASDIIKITGISNANIEITNINGQVLFSKTNLNETSEINIKDLSIGSYFIKIITDTDEITIPFVKK